MSNKCEQPSHPQPNQKPQFPHKPTKTNHVLDQLNSSSSNPKYHTFTTTTTNHDDDDQKNNMKNNNNKVIWDCGSSLYDSVELDSFRKQLDFAIVNSSRTQSMPRLPSDNHRACAPPPQKQKKPSSSKFSRSFHKLVRSLFGAPSSKSDKNTQSSPDPDPDPWFFDSTYEKDNTYYNYVVYEKPDIIGLSSIPEVPEGIDASPKIGRKTMSQRFTTSASISSPGIYCA